VRRLVALNTPHPRRLRSALLTDPRGQLRATARYVLAFQVPRHGERLLTRDGGSYPARLMSEWSGPAWRRTDDHAEAVRRCVEAIRIPLVAHSALEYYRWAIRSLPRPDGLRYARLMQQPITAPTLQLHGTADPVMLTGTAQGSGRYVAGPYEWRLLHGLGHFPHQEAPELITGEILRWAKDG